VAHGHTDELGLSLCVRLAVVCELLRQPALQRTVCLGDIAVRAQVVAERELIVESLRACGHQVQVVRTPAWIGLAKPMHLLAPIRGIQISEPAEPLETGARLLEAVHANEDVDHRLGRQSLHRRAADVVHTAVHPLADRVVQRRALPLEALGPGGVVRHNPDRLVGHLLTAIIYG